MNLYEKVMAAYPDLDQSVFDDGIIVLRDDSDGNGEYIDVWDYEKPIPEGLKLGKDEL